MKTKLQIGIVAVILCFLILPVQAQDAKYRANDEKSMRIVPNQPGEYSYSNSSLKHPIRYKKAKPEKYHW